MVVRRIATLSVLLGLACYLSASIVEMRIAYDNEWLDFSENPGMRYYDDFEFKVTMIGQTRAEVHFPKLLNSTLCFAIPLNAQTDGLPMAGKKSSLQRNFRYIKLSLYPIRLISKAEFWKNIEVAYEQKDFEVRTELKRQLMHNGTLLHSGDFINARSSKEKLYIGHRLTYSGPYYVTPPKVHAGYYFTQIDRPVAEQNEIIIHRFASSGPYVQLRNLHFWMGESDKFKDLTVSLFFDEATFDLDFNSGTNLFFIVYGMNVNYGKTTSSKFTFGHEISKTVGYSLFKLSALIEFRF